MKEPSTLGWVLFILSGLFIGFTIGLNVSQATYYSQGRYDGVKQGFRDAYLYWMNDTQYSWRTGFDDCMDEQNAPIYINAKCHMYGANLTAFCIDRLEVTKLFSSQASGYNCLKIGEEFSKYCYWWDRQYNSTEIFK